MLLYEIPFVQMCVCLGNCYSVLSSFHICFRHGEDLIVTPFAQVRADLQVHSSTQKKIKDIKEHLNDGFPTSIFFGNHEAQRRL